jgi:hypothetical protein
MRFLALALVALVLEGCNCGGAEPIATITVKLRVAPASLDYGHVPVGASTTKSLAIVNSGNGPYEPDASALPSLTGAGFAVATPCALPLAPGSFCNVDIAFTPASQGDLSGTFTVHGPDGDLAVPLTGVGDQAQVVASPSSLDFGSLNVGDSATKSITVTNQGTADVTANFTVAGPGFFASAGGSSTSSSLSLTAGKSTTVAISFSPSQGGAAAGSAVVEICGKGCGPTVSLTGVATAPRIDVEPRTVDFGDVGVGQAKKIDLTVQNTGAGNLVVTAIAALVSTSEVAVDAGALPLVLAEGASAPLHVTYTPATPRGSLAGSLQVASNDPISPSVLLPITGDSPGAAIQILPNVANLGVLDAGESQELDVVVRSIGTVPANVTSIKLTGDSAFSFVAAPSPATLAPFESILFTVRATAAAGDVANGGAHGAVVVSADGIADVSMPMSFLSGSHGCQPRAVDPNLNLGSIVVGQGATGTLTLQNVGDAQCTLVSTAAAPGLPQDVGFSFSAVKAQTIPASGTGGIDFAWRATAEGQASMFLNVTFTDSTGVPSAPLLVSATARGVDGTLVGEPPLIQLGPILEGCPLPARTASFINAGGDGLNLLSMSLDPPNAPFSFPAPSVPQLITSGQALTFPVSGSTTTPGTFQAVLKAETDAVEATIRLQLEVDPPGQTVTETFTAGDISQVDVLFVVDNSGSMADNQQTLAQNFDTFINSAFGQNNTVDFHLGVTTTGVLDGSGGPLVAHWLQREGQTQLDSDFEGQALVGTDGSGIELGLEGMRRALDDDAGSGNNAGFYRPQAALSIVIVGDEDDNGGDPTVGQIDPSLARPVDTYIEFLRGLKGGNLTSTPVLVSTSCTPGQCDRYGAVATAFNGLVLDIGSQTWGQQLSQIGQATFGLQRLFRLNSTPDPSTVTVTVNGAPATFTVTGSDVILDQDPPAKATVVVSYQPGCAP